MRALALAFVLSSASFAVGCLDDGPLDSTDDTTLDDNGDPTGDPGDPGLPGNHTCGDNSDSTASRKKADGPCVPLAEAR